MTKHCGGLNLTVMAKRNKAFARWFKTQDPPRNTQTHLAKRLKVSVSTVNEILHGKRAPTLAQALLIQDLTGLSPRIFEKEGKR